jgi:hypothetical protein
MRGEVSATAGSGVWLTDPAALLGLFFLALILLQSRWN